MIQSTIKAVNVAGVRPRQILENLNIPDLPEAACKGYEPVQDFHPDNKSIKATKARELCSGCPERVKCLQWVMDYERKSGQQQSGVWGGLSPWERAELRRRRAGDAPLCRKQRHLLVGENVRLMPDGRVWCRACYMVSRVKGNKNRYADRYG